MTDKVVKICNCCQDDLEAAGYTVERFPAMLPTIGKCDVCKRRMPIYKAVLGKPRVDKLCGKVVESSAVTVLQHETTT